MSRAHLFGNEMSVAQPMRSLQELKGREKEKRAERDSERDRGREESSERECVAQSDGTQSANLNTSYVP